MELTRKNVINAHNSQVMYNCNKKKTISPLRGPSALSYGKISIFIGYLTNDVSPNIVLIRHLIDETFFNNVIKCEMKCPAMTLFS